MEKKKNFEPLSFFFRFPLFWGEQVFFLRFFFFYKAPLLLLLMLLMLLCYC